MIDILKWYLVVFALGLAAIPIAYRFFKFLPDKGYAFSKPLGILMTGYLYWILTYASITPNTAGGAVFALFIVVALSFHLLRSDFDALKSWLKGQRGYILGIEVLFLVVFAFFAFLRAANPEIANTEKPMEFAFLNAILRSPGFPPSDPWLSGYAISYYHFGYILVALITRLSTVPSAVAFNAAGVTWFSMAAVGVYGILFNLLRQGNIGSAWQAGRWSILAPVLVLIAGNLFIIPQMLHASGVGIQVAGDDTVSSALWDWVGHRSLVVSEAMPTGWSPGYPEWAWWPASRALTDTTLTGNTIEIIDEFPFFSVILSDLHPHVLNLPFVMLAIGLCLNLLYARRSWALMWSQPALWLKSAEFWFTTWLLGSLVFLNTWDFPVYLGLIGLAFLYAYSNCRGATNTLGKAIVAMIGIGIGALMLYLPFLIGFSSSAGGFLPSLVYQTRGIHFWIHFGAFLIPIFGYLLLQIRGQWRGIAKSFLIVVSIMVVLFLLMIVFGVILLKLYQAMGTSVTENSFLQRVGSGLSSLLLNQGFSPELLSSGDVRAFILAILGVRMKNPGTCLTLLAMGTLVVQQWRNQKIQPVGSQRALVKLRRGEANFFVLLLIVIGLILTVFPEFFYLRDVFGNRMNTIFKFYFQVWIVWGIAAAYAVTWLIHSRKKLATFVFVPLSILLILAAMLYPAQMIPVRTGYPGRPVSELSLDGSKPVKLWQPDQYEGYRWLSLAPYGVLTEAEGRQYSSDSAASTNSGLPTVLGWSGHESQWRGDTSMLAPRGADLKLLYETEDWGTAKMVLDRYNVRYVWLSSSEYEKYAVSVDKLASNLQTAYQNHSVTIFEYTPSP